jgi:hypothetical protein
VAKGLRAVGASKFFEVFNYVDISVDLDFERKRIFHLKLYNDIMHVSYM